MKESGYVAPSVPTLYHVPLCCSTIPIIVSSELGVPSQKFAVTEISATDLAESKGIAQISPRNVVPALAMPDGSALLEVGAIVMYLLERYDERHALHLPLGHPDRPRMFQGMFYGLTECYRRGVTLYGLIVDTPLEQQDKDEIAEAAAEYKAILVDYLATELKGKQFYAAGQYTIADIIFAYLLMLGDCVGLELIKDTAVRGYLDKIKKKPAFIQPFIPTTPKL